MTKEKIWVILAAVLLLFPAVAVAGAQGTPELPLPSSWVVISANPPEIPADGLSTSEIKVAVSWPEIIGGGPAANESVVMETNLSRLTEVGNESNSGSRISLVTDNNGTAIALLSGISVNETKVALIGVWWSEDEYNLTTTTVTFLAPGETPSPPSGDGDGGNGGAVTTPTPAAGVNVTPSPEATATPSPAVSVTPTPAVSPSPAETPSPSPTPKPLIPGFEAVFAIASLLSVAYLVLRRKR